MVQRCKDFSGNLLNQFILTSVLKCVSFSGGCKNSDFIDKAVVGMILMDNMPLMACQKKGMKSCFKKLFPNYELPSSDVVWRHSKKFYDACMVAIKASLAKRICDVSVTIDLVTLPKTSKSYLVMTAHFLNELHEMECLSLGCTRMKEVKLFLL